ncbi:terminase [Dyella acidisoli]|uniref:Terminase n=1 Tax=Dyella acidisoli TaxID=1867834 RepID=A0ABQ5XLK6_9GAMM|nr:terminase [Dyella acidisoli]GLQ91446.1 hypothetical protein GCM10007901_03960 [Dyella acidisoli]
MGIAQLLGWQWNGYSRYHQSRINLLLHIFVVPVFLAGNVALVVAIIKGFWIIGFAGLAAMVLSVALQGRGHRQEAVLPEPFTSPINAVSRIFLEQWITFPRFVLSGGWLKAMRHP